jgi:hypothetical protein
MDEMCMYTFHREMKEEKLSQRMNKYINSRTMHFAFFAERHSAADAPRGLKTTFSHSPPLPDAVLPISEAPQELTISDQSYSITDGPAARPFAVTDSVHLPGAQEPAPAVSRTPGVMPPPHFRASPYPQGVPFLK